MNRNEKLYALLTATNEDCIPFWEAGWEIGGFGDVAAVAEVQQLLSEMLRHDLIGVSRGHDWPPSADREVEVTKEEAEAIIAEPANWRLPGDDEQVVLYFCFYATPAGYQLWQKGETGFHLPEQV